MHNYNIYIFLFENGDKVIQKISFLNYRYILFIIYDIYLTFHPLLKNFIFIVKDIFPLLKNFIFIVKDFFQFSYMHLHL